MGGDHTDCYGGRPSTFILIFLVPGIRPPVVLGFLRRLESAADIGVSDGEVESWDGHPSLVEYVMSQERKLWEEIKE